METTIEKNTATFTHLSALTQYFIPFEYIFPYFWSSKVLNLWITTEQVLNFQLSLLLYSLCFVAVPTF
jgi:uncharacterized Tic20 family protein